MKNKVNKGLIIAAVLAVVLCVIGTPSIKGAINTWKYNIQKTDDATNYKTLKEVEDTCRNMIVAYKSDRVTYEMYKESADKDEKNWANSAKIRANQTAIKYNDYMLKNSFVWKNNIPNDISSELEILE